MGLFLNSVVMNDRSHHGRASFLPQMSLGVVAKTQEAWKCSYLLGHGNRGLCCYHWARVWSACPWEPRSYPILCQRCSAWRGFQGVSPLPQRQLLPRCWQQRHLELVRKEQDLRTLRDLLWKCVSSRLEVPEVGRKTDHPQTGLCLFLVSWPSRKVGVDSWARGGHIQGLCTTQRPGGLLPFLQSWFGQGVNRASLVA